METETAAGVCIRQKHVDTSREFVCVCVCVSASPPPPPSFKFENNAPRDLVGEVDVPRGVHQVQEVVVALVL